MGAFGIPPTRWFYGWFGVWVAQTFAFTPIAFMIMRGVVQGVAPSLEEAAQTLRASPRQTFMTVTLPLLKPGLANAFLVGFIESMADFGNPIVVGGQFSVLSTEIFFAIVGAQYDQGRAASLAWMLTLFALTVFRHPARAAGQAELHHRVGQGRLGHCHAAARGRAPAGACVALPWMAFTLVVYLFAFAGRLCADLGARLHAHAEPLPHRVLAGMGAVRPGLGGHGMELVLHHIKLAAISAPMTATVGLLIAWLLARTEFRGQGAFEFAALAGLCHSRHGAGRELHPGVQRAAGSS
jgi:iron(III) transport system permease protein